MHITEIGRVLGLVEDERWETCSKKREAIETETARLRSTWLRPEMLTEEQMKTVMGSTMRREHNLLNLLVRPEVDYQNLMTLPGTGQAVADPMVSEQIEIQARYGGYIERQREEIARQAKYENTPLGGALNYDEVRGLSNEVRQKLNDQKPTTVGEAGRIPGITPAAISLLLVYLKKKAA